MIAQGPIGVVAARLRWHFPSDRLGWKIGLGYRVIVKPAKQTGEAALREAKRARDAGVPRGVRQVLPGDGPNVRDPLNPADHIGALIDAEPCAKLRSNLDDRVDGPFMAPVVVEAKADDARARQLSLTPKT